jgi:SAM-dependent methyltransferase
MRKRVWPARLYGFLEFIDRRRKEGDTQPRILDCGAGGKCPPLGLFYEHGYQTFGIDFSKEQVRRAEQFCQEKGMDLHIQEGDVRHIPFEDAFFDHVYEYDTLWRLTKEDARRAIQEMRRVLREDGYCYVSFQSLDCWPLTGREEKLGEFWFAVAESPYPGDAWYGAAELVYSYYAKDEPEQYLGGFEVVHKEKRTTFYAEHNVRASPEDWSGRYREEWTRYTREEWDELYEERLAWFRWSRTEYILRKLQGEK